MSYVKDSIDLAGYPQPGNHGSPSPRKKSVGPAPDTMGFGIGPNVKGTGTLGVPTAIAEKGKKKKLPAVANPDGKDNRS